MAIFKVTAVPDFSQLRGEITKLQSTPVTLGVDTQSANVSINATRQNLKKLTETFSPSGELVHSVSSYRSRVGEAVQVTKTLDRESGKMEVTSKRVTQSFDAQAKAAQKAAQQVQAAKESSGFADLMGDSFARVTAKMALWQVMGNAIASVKRSFEEALDTMRSVDDEMVTIRKVTGATAAELKDIEEQAYKTASAYGVAADEHLNSVANFSRAGYGEQASALAELATKTQIVGDTDAETAQQFLLSVDAAYRYQGSIESLTKVLDGANEIDNRYATSITKIAEGLGKVAPIAAQAHVGVDELTAAIGTITAVTQRSGTEASTALRALFLNIIGDTKTEIDEGVTWTTGEIAGLRDVIKVYAKDAYEAAQATGSVINPMKAIAGLAQSMKDGLLTEQQLMEMVSDIGGKLRTSQLLALIQNWDMYQSMLGDYADAVGSADKEVENALDSWSRKTEILHNKWTEFVSHLVETDDIKGALDGVIALVEFLDSDMGRLTVQVGLTVAAVVLLNKGLTALTTKTGIGTFLGVLTSAMGGNAMAATQLAGNLKGILAVLPKLGVGAAIFAALAVAIGLSTQKTREYENALKGVEGAQTALEDTDSEYNELIGKTEQLTGAEEKRLAVLKELRREQEAQLEAAQKEAWLRWNDLRGTGANVIVGGATGVGGGIGTGAVVTERADIAALEEYREALAGVEALHQQGKMSAGAYYDALTDLNAAREEDVETIRAAIAAGYDVSDQQRALVDAYDRVQQILGVTGNATAEYVNELIEEARQSGATGKQLYDLVAAQIAASNTKLSFSQQIMALQQLATQAGYASAEIAGVFALAGLNETNLKRTAAGLMQTGRYGSYEEAYAEAMRRMQSSVLYEWGKMTSSAKKTDDEVISDTSSPDETARRKAAQAAIKALEKERDAQTDAIDERIDALKKQNEEIERGEKLEELKLDILKRQDELLNARNERTVRQYNAATGQWEWVADPSKVKKAEEALEEAKRDLRDYEREVETDLAIEELEARKKAIEAAYQIKIDAWNDYLDGLSNAIAREKELLDQSVRENLDAAEKIKKAQETTGTGSGGSGGTVVSPGGTDMSDPDNRDSYPDRPAAGTYNNMGISAATIKQMQKWFGVAADGMWGQGSYDAANYRNASEANQFWQNHYYRGKNEFGRASSYAELKSRYNLYDSGGVLQGMGGIKATARDEMILPPDITARLLKPAATPAFTARMQEMRYLLGMTPSARGVAGNSDNRSYTDHSGAEYHFGGITLTQERAERTSVAELAQLAHHLQVYGG